MKDTAKDAPERWVSHTPFQPTPAWRQTYIAAHGHKPHCMICGVEIARRGLRKRKRTPRLVMWLGPAPDPDAGQGGPNPIVHVDCAVKLAKQILEEYAQVQEVG